MKNELVGQMVRVAGLGTWVDAIVTGIAPSGKLICRDKFGGVSHAISDTILTQSQCAPKRSNYTPEHRGTLRFQEDLEHFNIDWASRFAEISSTISKDPLPVQ